MQSQITSHILMIRPVRFAFNEQTATTNAFQDQTLDPSAGNTTQQEALAEFDEMVRRLQAIGVDVIVYEDTTEPHTPDSIFPNNWVSFHYSGTVVLYPMQAPNRRLERRSDIVNDLEQRFTVERVVDLTSFEEQDKFLEGTGSLVLDRMQRIAYACLSPRTNEDVLAEFSRQTGYKVVAFSAVDANGTPIYHTNVLMCIGDSFAVVCLASIQDPDDRLRVRQSLEKSGKYIIPITMDQMAHFAGNMLLVANQKGQKLLVMSTQALESLTQQQRNELGEFATLLPFDLSVIEQNGGGSARCMMAEIYLPPNS